MYDYIVTYDQLINASLQNPDLPYPLRKETKRDRIIVNSESLREAINKATETVLEDFEHKLFVYLQNDVTSFIENATYSIMTDFISLGSSRNSSSKNDPAYKLGAMFGVAIGNAISDYVCDTLELK